MRLTSGALIVASAAVFLSVSAIDANAVTVVPPTSISGTYDLTLNAPSTQVSFGNNDEWAEFVFTVSASQSDTLGIVAQGNNTVNFNYESFISPSTYESGLSGNDASTPFSLAYAGGTSGTTYDVFIDDAVDPTVDVRLTGISSTPLPAALPLFAGGLGFVGYLGRKKRKAGQALAAA
jgi:hypothetical protein